MNIPKKSNIAFLQFRNEGVVLEEIEIPHELTILEAIYLIPDIGFRKKPTQSRAILVKLAEKIEEKILDQDYNKALDLLKILKVEVNVLIKPHYPITGQEISRSELKDLIRKETHKLRKLVKKKKKK